MTLDEYRHFVGSLAHRRDGKPFFNASIEHASVVIETLFANAGKKVDVLTGNFNPRVYGRDTVIMEAKLFLASSWSNKIRILLEEDDPQIRKIHPFFVEFATNPNIEVRLAPSEVQDLYGFHFVVVDDDCYRFESDKSKPAAVAAFGDSRGARNLNDIYSQLWDRSNPIEIISTK